MQNGKNLFDVDFDHVKLKRYEPHKIKMRNGKNPFYSNLR